MERRGGVAAHAHRPGRGHAAGGGGAAAGLRVLPPAEGLPGIHR